MSDKTRNYIAIQLVLQQCCKTSCSFFVACFTVPYGYIVLEFTMISMQEYDFSLQTNEDKIKIFCRISYLLHSHFILARELKQFRRRRQLQKTIGLMIKTTALHMRHAF